MTVHEIIDALGKGRVTPAGCTLDAHQCQVLLEYIDELRYPDEDDDDEEDSCPCCGEPDTCGELCSECDDDVGGW